MEAIILAGGLGTRLHGVIGEAPKCMAPVAGKPFLHYIFTYLARQRCDRIILSLGYKHEAVLRWLQTEKPPFEVDWVVEEEPLGTGGGIRLALSKAHEEEVFILNGDTFFDVDLRAMQAFHRSKSQYTDATIALKTLRDFSRYGTVETDDSGMLVAFKEKAPTTEGRINGGVYLTRRGGQIGHVWRDRKAWSFEKDFLEWCDFTDRGQRQYTFYGYESEGYFIDIGVPEDYERAQLDFVQLFPPEAS